MTAAHLGHPGCARLCVGLVDILSLNLTAILQSEYCPRFTNEEQPQRAYTSPKATVLANWETKIQNKCVAPEAGVLPFIPGDGHEESLPSVLRS